MPGGFTGSSVYPGGNSGSNGPPPGYSISYNTDASGNDEPHNNMQPYLIMNYIIKY